MTFGFQLSSLAVDGEAVTEHQPGEANTSQDITLPP